VTHISEHGGRVGNEKVFDRHDGSVGPFHVDVSSLAQFVRSVVSSVCNVTRILTVKHHVTEQRRHVRNYIFKNGVTVLSVANLMADSESERPDSYSSFLDNHTSISLSFGDIRV